MPTIQPSQYPTVVPTKMPTIIHSVAPTHQPSVLPTERPTAAPSVEPTFHPSRVPTERPTSTPTSSPTEDLCCGLKFAYAGRAYPDLAAMAQNYSYVIDGKTQFISSTQSSAVIAGIFSLVNAARVRNNQSLLGFVNPALYSYSEYFVNDITSGENGCTSDDGNCCAETFVAKAGWDPVTGLGSVNATEMIGFFTNISAPLPSPTFAPTVFVTYEEVLANQVCDLR
jgi:hypothetical protein